MAAYLKVTGTAQESRLRLPVNLSIVSTQFWESVAGVILGRICAVGGGVPEGPAPISQLARLDHARDRPSNVRGAP